MNEAERNAIARQLEERLIAYWWDVDLNWGATAHTYYTENAIFATSARERQGHTEITEFYTQRKQRGERIARHVVSNFRATVIDARTANCRWILTLYAADGAPVLPSAVPTMIADGVDECVLEADGVWRCLSRRLLPLFKSDVATTG